MSETRYCRQCNTFYPLETGFRLNAQNNFVCLVCTRSASRRSYAKHIEKRQKESREFSQKHIDRKPAYEKAYRERHPDKIREYAKTRYQRDKAKCRARRMIRYAIKKGVLKRLPCEICGLDDVKLIDAHHKDYFKPLEVQWLCKRCHGKEHRKYD